MQRDTQLLLLYYSKAFQLNVLTTTTFMQTHTIYANYIFYYNNKKITLTLLRQILPLNINFIYYDFILKINECFIFNVLNECILSFSGVHFSGV